MPRNHDRPAGARSLVGLVGMAAATLALSFSACTQPQGAAPALKLTLGIGQAAPSSASAWYDDDTCVLVASLENGQISRSATLPFPAPERFSAIGTTRVVFEFPDLPAGEYLLSVSKVVLASLHAGSPPLGADIAVAGANLAIGLGPGENNAALLLEDLTARVRGRIVNGSGTPLAWLPVSAERSPNPFTRTGPDGRFELDCYAGPNLIQANNGGPTPLAYAFVASTEANPELGSLMLGAPVASLISQGQPVTVSSFEAAGLEGAKAVDGDNASTRWASGLSFVSPESITIDLGVLRTVVSVNLYWYYSATSYTIEASNDGVAFSVVYGPVAGPANFSSEALGVTGAGRYLRLKATGSNGPNGISLYEFQVFGY